VEQVLLPLMRDVMRVETMDELKQAFFEELVARQTEAEAGAVEAATATEAAEAKAEQAEVTVVAAEAKGVDAEVTAYHAEASLGDASEVTGAVAADAVVDGVKAARRRSMDLNRRMRCWTDGLVIGSEKFVREIMSRARGVPIDSGHRVMKLETGADVDDLCAWRRLRASGG
jgi:hypothetical protein